MVIKNASLDIVCGIFSEQINTNRQKAAFEAKTDVGK